MITSIIRAATWLITDVADIIDSMEFGKEEWGGVAGGTATALTVSTSPVPSALANGMKVSFLVSTTNNGASTLNWNGKGATNILDIRTGLSLVGNEMFATGIYTCLYYNSAFYLLNGSPASAVWSPTLTGFSVNPTSASYYWKGVGKFKTLYISQGGDGTSNGTGCTISLPFTAATITNASWSAPLISAKDNGSFFNTGIAVIASAGTVINLYKDHSGAAWTNANGKRTNLIIEYQSV